jgi:hypothetical protein
MARIAAGLVAILSLTLVAGAGAQKPVHEDAVPKGAGSLIVTDEELEQLQRRRAEAMRKDLEVARQLERLPERELLYRSGGPTTWGLWDTF